ncbi:hypothetical protein K505DRAFT_240585, partial [Melanomma pulvis-pyrius CBS 109.77]
RSLREPPRKVLAGSEQAVYYIHPGVLSACKSSAASIRMNGNWKDTGDGDIDWTDSDKQTVECVLHYLYTGDYHVPDSEEETSAITTKNIKNDLKQTEKKPPRDGEPSTLSQTPFPDESSLKRSLTPFQECVVAARSEYAVKETILTHARVYSFAHRYQFCDLANLALQRLTQILNVAPRKRTALFPHLADAIRHIYDTTPGPELRDDPARKLLSQYIASNYTNLVGEELNDLAGEGGELMVDVSSKLARLLVTRSSSISALQKQNNGLSAEVALLKVACNKKDKEILQVRLEKEESEASCNGYCKKGRRNF